ncbi:Calx-beta domain-containing protein [Thermopirellula anaerolimosa]
MFTFTRDITSGSLTVYYTIDSSSTASLNADYTGPSMSGSVTFSAGASSVTLNVVPVDDSLVEGNETVVLRIQSGSGSGSSYLLGSASSASVLITDNDALATVNVAATQNAAEPSQSGYFTFTRDVTSGSLTVYYTIDSSSTASLNADYTGPSMSGSVSFAAGEASVTLAVTPVDDTLVEGTESVVLRLQANSQSSSSYALGSSSSASLLVADDDVPATVNVAATQNAAEPSQSGYFTFTRDVTSGSLTVYYTIDSSSTASLNADYTGPSMSGSVSFAAGEASVTLAVTPVDDTLVETDETVVLRLQSSSMSGSSYTLGSMTSATLLVVDDEPPAVTLLKLLNDTGTSPYDLITTDPTLTGQISSRGNSTDVSVEFDYDGDGTVDASTVVEDREFTHTPASLPLGPLTIHARAKRWDAGQSTYVYGGWTSLGFTLADGVNHAPGVTALGLANGTQDAGGAWSTTDPTLVGDVANDGPLAFLKVEFDWTADGEADGEARTDQAGHFRYKPPGLQPGEITVQARAVEWDADTSMELVGVWTSFTFTLEEAAGPTVANLQLVNDTGESATDLVTTDPRIAGDVTGVASFLGLTIEVDTNGDGTAEGTTLTDNQGHFTYTPRGLQPGEITLQVRAVVAGTGTEQGTQGPWASLTFTLVAVTPALVTNLHLENDTGESSSDNITADPDILGQASRQGEQARLTVQFDHNGDDQIDGTTLTDLDGNFRYTPIGLANGEVTLRARVAEWDRINATYLYGQWASFTFTLEDAPEAGSGGGGYSYPGGPGSDFTSAAEAYERAVASSFASLDTIIVGSDPTPGVFDALEIGTFLPVATLSGAFLPYLTDTTAPTSHSYSSTDTFDQTVTTANGQYTIHNTATTTYDMDVTGDATSGTFTIDVSINQTTLYDEVADVTGLVLSYHYTINQPGTYIYTYHASGSYSLTGGVIVYSGTFTSHEEGTSDSVADYDGTSDGLWLTTTWDWHNESHWGFTRDESGSFGASGVTSTYTLTEWGNGSYTSDESGDYLDTSTTTYSSVTNEWDYLLSSAGLWNWSYVEHGSVTPNGTTGDYSYDESASDTYDYFEEGSYSYGYLDAYTSQSSTYDYTKSVDETSASSYSEDGTFDASGSTGTFTYHEQWDYSEDWIANGTDSYSFAWGGRTSGWSYGYTETSTWDGSDAYDEWGNFTPTVTTADWSWDEEAIETYSYNGSGTDGWTCTDANTTQTYTATFTDTEGWTYGYTYGEDGHYVDTYDTAGLLVSSTENGSYSFDESENGTWSYGNSATYTFSVDDGHWLGSYTGNSSYTESGNWDYTFSDAGTFLDDDQTGAYLWAENESWTWTSGGTGSAYYTYTADYTTGWHSYSGTQSGSGGGQYHYFESTAYTPDSTLGLYSSSESSNSIYHYAETGSNHFSYANAGTSTDWGGGWSISDDYTYDYGYDEAGLVTEDGPIGAYTLSEGDLELYRWSAWGDYDYDYADATTTASNDWAWSESFGYDWGSDYFEWGVFGPGGEVGLYDYSEEYAESWDYNGSGDWFSDYATTNVTSHSSGHWSYVGWDDYGFVVSDVGSFSEDGEVGFYSLQEAWAGSYTYDANGSASRTETYPGGTYTYPGGYTYVVPGTTTSGSSSYTYHGNWTYSGSAEYDKAYDEPGETCVSFYDYEHVADGTTTGHAEGNSSYSGPGGSSSTSYVSDSTGSTHDEWHTTTLSAWSVTVGSGGWPIWTLLGSVSDHSEVHTTSSNSTWTQTSTVNGTSSTTSGSYSSSSSTPSSSHTETGTPPSGPPTAPTYSGPDDTDFDTLLTALATTAAGAYTTPSTLGSAIRSGVTAFLVLDADENASNRGATLRSVAPSDLGPQTVYDLSGRLTALVDGNWGVTTLTYDEDGNLASLTDPEGNTTEWVYDEEDRLIQEIDPLDESRYYTYDTAGDLVRYVDRDGEVRQYEYDSQHRVVTETWYANTTDADAQQNALNTIEFAYDSAGRIVWESDDFSSASYTYDSQGRLVGVTQTSVSGPTVVLTYTYEGQSTQPASMATSIDGTADFLNTYEYDTEGRLVQITQTGQTAGNAVAEKQIVLTYNSSGQVATITRYLDEDLVVQADYEYDSSGRLTGLVYHQGQSTLASYSWTYSSEGSSLVSNPESLIPSSWLPNGGLPVIGPVGVGEGMLPVHDTKGIPEALVAGTYYSDVTPVASATSSDGTVTYSYDATGQLIGADYSGSPADESYAYDANGNRTNPGYVIGAGNRLLSDGTYRYLYDAEGNRIARFIDVDEDGVLDGGDTDITQYTWDNRNRLVQVTDRAVFGGDAVQIVTYLYDAENRWIGETVDSDGDGTVDHQTWFAYDGNQIVLEFDKEGTGDVTGEDLSHRYLWGPAVDQVLSDEQVTDPQTPGSVLWPLTDRLGTVGDLAVYDAQTGVTSVANHRVYDSFGNLKSETNAAVDFLFGFTGRAFDETTGFQNNLNRWYDPAVGRWLSQDPLGFHAGDFNVYRYVGNNPALAVDPTGLWWGWDEWREAIKAFSNELFVNEIYGGAKALVTGEAGRQLGNRCVGIVETQTGKPFRGTTSEWARFGRAVAGDVVGVNQIVEGASGYDISNQQELDAWERARRAAGGTGALAGTAAGGIYAAGKYAPATFPTAAKAAGLTPASTVAQGAKPAWPGNDPAQAPLGTKWRGKPGSTPGSDQGNYYNPATGESFHPDLNHPPPVGPHWDYRASDGTWYRIMPDGSMVPKRR